MKLAGNVALVTGSGQRMGKAIVLALAEAGANVVVNAVSNREAMDKTAEEARTHGVQAIGCRVVLRAVAALQQNPDCRLARQDALDDVAAQR